MHYYLLKFITFIHILLVLFVVIVPFTNINYLLLLHAIIVPFIMLHWILNNNTCALTLMEKHLKKIVYGEIDENECITCKLIEPIYDFKNNYESFSKIIYSITLGLWMLSIGKLYYKYHTGQINNFINLFTL